MAAANKTDPSPRSGGHGPERSQPAVGVVPVSASLLRAGLL